jgi:hypothetical protein
VQGGFRREPVAIVGVALLLVHEWNAAPLGGNVGLGIVLAIGGMLAASIANVVQANPTGRGVPMVSCSPGRCSMARSSISDMRCSHGRPAGVPTAWPSGRARPTSRSSDRW